jgi:hypothetical protein
MNHLANVANTASDLTNRTIQEGYAPWSQIGSDVASTFREGQWLGLDQPAVAAARGISTDEQRRQDEEAYHRLGFLGMPVTGAGYWAGGGALGVGKALASEAFAPLANYMRPTIARYASGIIGSASEGGAANYASTLFHGGSLSDAAKNFWSGLGWGAGGGALGGGQSDASATTPVQRLRAQEGVIYAPLDDLHYQGADASNVIQGVTDKITGKEGDDALKLATSTNAQLKKFMKPDASQELTGQAAMDYLISQKGSMSSDDYRAAMNDLTKTGKVAVPGDASVSAADVQHLQERLRDISGDPSSSNQDKRFAAQYADGLDWLHQNAQPMSGGDVGDAADILDRGRPITGQRKSAEMLDRWARQADITGDPTYPASAARKELIDNPPFYATRDPTQQGGYNINDPRTVALQALGDSGEGGWPGYQGVKHGASPLIHAGAGEILGQSFGHPVIGSAGGFGLYGLLAGYNKAAEAANAGRVRQRYEQAYPTLTGGAQAPLPAPSRAWPEPLPANLREAIRNAIFGYTATGQPLYSSAQQPQ